MSVAATVGAAGESAMRLPLHAARAFSFLPPSLYGNGPRRRQSPTKTLFRRWSDREIVRIWSLFSLKLNQK